MQLNNSFSTTLRLSPPHENIILTAPRMSDGPSVIETQNDPAVYMNLSGLPFPYTEADWDAWFPIHWKAVNEAIEEWKIAETDRNNDVENLDWRKRKWLAKGIPCPAVREVDETTGEERFIGEINIRRAEYIMMILLPEERQKMRDANDALESGDPDVEWEIGFYLSPKCHGRGIMPAVFKRVIEEMCIPHMNVRRLTGTFFESNWGSRRVFEKCGFVFDCKLDDAVELDERKTGMKGKKMGIERMRWKGCKDV